MTEEERRNGNVSMITDIASLKVQYVETNRRLGNLDDKIDHISSRVDDVVAILNTTKGEDNIRKEVANNNFKILGVVGAFSGAVWGGIGWLLNHFVKP